MHMRETGIGREVEIYAKNVANKTKHMSTNAFADNTLRFASVVQVDPKGF
jgi:hypothetical protein